MSLTTIPRRLLHRCPTSSRCCDGLLDLKVESSGFQYELGQTGELPPLCGRWQHGKDEGETEHRRRRRGSKTLILFPLPLFLTTESPPPSVTVQWSDLAALQSQLQIQRLEIQSLTQKVVTMETERNSHIQKLQEEVQRLKVRGGEEWRREVGRELSSLRGHLDRAASIENLEDSLSSKLQHLRRDVDLLKSQLRGQEEELLHLQEETRESRRRGQHTYRTVEQMTDSLLSQSTDLTKVLSDTQREVQQIRSTVTQLQEQIRTLKEPLPSVHTPGASPLLSPPHRRLAPELDSDLEDLSPTPNLDEVSSDDLSWTDHKDLTDLRQKPSPTHRSAGDPHLLDDEDCEDDFDDFDDDELHDNAVNSDVGSDLSLNDL